MSKYIDINGVKALGLDIFNSIEHIIVGNTQRDLILRTKGKIKVQYGSKFYNLFNFGESNTDDTFVTRSQVQQMISEAINS